MTKEDGKYYKCDQSLIIKREDTMGNDARQYYYVAPIVTDDTFREDVIQHYNTPAKNQGGGLPEQKFSSLSFLRGKEKAIYEERARKG